MLHGARFLVLPVVPPDQISFRFFLRDVAFPIIWVKLQREAGEITILATQIQTAAAMAAAMAAAKSITICNK
jgi:hypothetical protein